MRKWRCTVYGYIHVGTEPPEVCPVCGAGREAFVDDGPAEIEGAMPPEVRREIRTALRRISYGLYIVGTDDGGRLNGMTCNTCIQVAEDPLRAVIAINKASLTWEILRRHPAAAVSILGEDGGYELARHFGLRSGREADKWADIPRRLAANGCPLLERCAGFLELTFLPGAELDAGDHTVFLAEIRSGSTIGEGKALTYERYQEMKFFRPALKGRAEL